MAKKGLAIVRSNLPGKGRTDDTALLDLRPIELDGFRLRAH